MATAAEAAAPAETPGVLPLLLLAVSAGMVVAGVGRLPRALPLGEVVGDGDADEAADATGAGVAVTAVPRTEESATRWRSRLRI